MCLPGQFVVTSATPERDRTCADCSFGTFSTEGNVAACTEWRDCELGEFDTGDAPSSTRDRECTSYQARALALGTDVCVVEEPSGNVRCSDDLRTDSFGVLASFHSTTQGFGGCGSDPASGTWCWERGEVARQVAAEFFDPLEVASPGVGCGVSVERRVSCWGDANLIAGVPAGNVLDLAVGEDFACAVMEADRAVVCWGDVPESVPGDDDWHRIAAWGNGACARTAFGLGGDTTRCFGDRSYSNLAFGTIERLAVQGTTLCTLDSAGRIACVEDDRASWRAPGVLATAVFSHMDVGLVRGVTHVCGILAEIHRVVCWDRMGTLAPPF